MPLDVDTTVSTQLPRWKSHKEVWGDRIAEIHQAGPDDELQSVDDSGIRWVLDCRGVIFVTKDLIARGQPQVGDYFVQYDDGYKSWSPAQPFEEGYTRL